MNVRDVLLIEIGCEEIPSRMIAAAADELARGVCGILEQSGLEHGSTLIWSGPRRLAVRVDDVESRQADRKETVLGPPARIAFTAEGKPTAAARGFAGKKGIEVGELVRIETSKGVYAGLERKVEGRFLGALLAEDLPGVVQGISFPKTMRWSEGSHRWVRPVHWVVALFGSAVLPVELFGVRAGDHSEGHRFLHEGTVRIPHPDLYPAKLEKACVLVDPAERRARIEKNLREGARALGGRLVEDASLLDEVANLVEWPGVVTGRFAETYLELPDEILATTLRRHQKCFSVRGEAGDTLPVFLAVANTAEDRGGHIRRGNEWVVGGRLEDARFFWSEDRKRALAERSDELRAMVFHGRGGSYADKVRRVIDLSARIGRELGLDPSEVERCELAARLAKNDLVTGTVGEFPELQGVVGGRLLMAEGVDHKVSEAVYAHYQPVGPGDAIPSTIAGCVVSMADKLDSVACLIEAGEAPTGSRDPYGLRRAGAGILRILLERELPLTLAQLNQLVGGQPTVLDFLGERLVGLLREKDYSINEIFSVMRPRVRANEVYAWSLSDIVARLEAIKRVRGREDFRQLVQLTQRVDKILTKDADALESIIQAADPAGEYVEKERAAVVLEQMVDRYAPQMDLQSAQRCYDGVVDILSRFIDPVEGFFEEVLVVNRKDPMATLNRRDLLARLGILLTRYFDIRELAGQAEKGAN